MPVISRFLGIVIFMHWREHRPPHFHVVYADHEAEIAILTGAVLGYLPPRALKLVQEWRRLHKAELMANWRRSEEKRAFRKIAPLE